MSVEQQAPVRPNRFLKCFSGIDPVSVRVKPSEGTAESGVEGATKRHFARTSDVKEGIDEAALSQQRSKFRKVSDENEDQQLCQSINHAPFGTSIKHAPLNTRQEEVVLSSCEKTEEESVEEDVIVKVERKEFEDLCQKEGMVRFLEFEFERSFDIDFCGNKPF